VPIEWTWDVLRIGRRSLRAATRWSTAIEPGSGCPQSIVSLPCPSFSHEGPTMLRRLPPLNALEAFEAAARHESFTRAAEQLCVTQGAVSHRVKSLEAELGIKLFNRDPNPHHYRRRSRLGHQRVRSTTVGRAFRVDLPRFRGQLRSWDQEVRLPASRAAVSDLAPTGDRPGRNGVACVMAAANPAEDAHASVSTPER